MAPSEDSPKLPAPAPAPREGELVLLRRAQRGDREAFAALVESYWERIYRWLYRLTRHQQTSEDLAQETFLKAFAHLATFQRGGNFQAWLYRIAYNSFLNQRRVAVRTTLEAYPENLPGGEAGPEEQAMSREALDLLARAVSRLPSDFRGAFLLRAEEGLSFREIAEVLDITEQTARWRVFKARQKLLNILGPQLVPSANGKPKTPEEDAEPDPAGKENHED